MKYCEGLDCEICNEKEPCIYRRANELQQCIDDIEEQVEDIISEKCSKPCERCTGRLLCDKYYILRLIKKTKDGE